MKKRALAFGLSIALLVQPIAAPVAFATDNSAESPAVASTEQTVSAQAKSYSHTISDEGLELIKSFEGYSAYPIWDVSQFSFGYGSYVDSTTVYEDPSSPTGYSTTLYPNGIPEREAADLLREMVEDFNVHLNIFLEQYKISLNQNQFDALSSFTYNLGKYVWSSKNYIFMQMLKSGEYLTDHDRFIESYTSICNAGGVQNQGLKERRRREVAIFYSDDCISDPNADLYVVNATTLYVRSEPATTGKVLTSLKSPQVIRVHRYSDDGNWAYTSYCGYFGWVSVGYLISINESALVTQIDATGKDGQGVYYSFDNHTMTATVGSASTSANSSKYNGEYAGEVFLTKYLLYKGSIYTLTSISDSAFTSCDKINRIYIPPCVTSIGANSFKNSSLKEILYATGSYAEGWAKSSAFTATDYRCRAGHLTADWRIVQKVSDSAPQIEQRSCSVCGETQTRQYDHIEITSFPKKTEYKEGAAFEPNGLALEIVYSDGTRIPAPSYKITSCDTSKLGAQPVTVKYSTMTTQFTIQVSEKTLTGISIQKAPTKLTYIEGNALNTAGLVVHAKYDSGVSTAVNEYSVSGYNPNKVGKQKITVTYNGFTATFEVTVKAKSLSAFTFSSYPDKLEYFCGESFSSAGMVLKLSYDNGTVEYANSGFKISGYNSSKAGIQKVKVSYGGLTQSIQVVVILNYLKSDKYSPKNGIVYVSKSGQTVSQITSQFDSGDRVELVRDGKVLPDDSTIGTGMTIRLRYNEQVQDSAKVIVLGDLTGDGKCTVSDFMALSDYFVERIELSKDALLAADIDRDGEVDLADYVEIYNSANSEINTAPLSA